MKTGNVPGFTADTSLYIYKHSRSYRMLTDGKDSTSSSVIPQLPRFLRCAIARALVAGACERDSGAACLAAVSLAMQACSD